MVDIEAPNGKVNHGMSTAFKILDSLGERVGEKDELVPQNPIER